MNLLDSNLSHYCHQWGATQVPFCDDFSQPLFLTPPLEKALQHLTTCANLSSVLTLSADHGLGKSALLTYWLLTLEPKI